MAQDLLAANWDGFLAINGGAGTHGWLDQVMIFSASGLIVLLPALALILWVVMASWWPAGRLVAGVTPPERRGGQRAAIGAALAAAFALALSVGIGAALYEPRPFVSHPAQDHLLIA